MTPLSLRGKEGGGSPESTFVINWWLGLTISGGIKSMEVSEACV